MKQVISILCFILLTNAAFAQSGHKSTPKPKETPAIIDPDDPSQYSESKPRPPKFYPLVQHPTRSEVKGDQPQTKPSTTINSDQKDDDEILRVETNLVTIPVSVFDKNGLYIPGLRQQDFRIFEDGVEQQIEYFGKSDKPFTVVLLLDTSRSTAFKIEEIRLAANAFVKNLEPQDRVMVIQFQRDIHVLTEPTSDRDKISKAIEKANFDNGTSLYDAVDVSLRKWLGKTEGRKAIVLFTDGVDTTSRKQKYDTTVNEAEEADTLIFPIYYNTFFDDPKNNLGGINGGDIPELNRDLGPIGTRPQDYALGRKYLEDLADATGGRVFRPESTPGGLTAAFEGIAEELRRQYNIGYTPKDEGKTGQRKQIKVRLNRPNLIIRARDSYIVGAVTAAPTPSATPAK